MKSVFIDLDGTLIEHTGNLEKQLTGPPKLLPGVLEKFSEWDKKNYNIIITTGRKESLRKLTESQLNSLHIVYDQLVMGLGPGERFLINDHKPGDDTVMAVAIELERNQGLTDVDI